MCSIASVSAQDPGKSPLPTPDGEVLRINTDLIQTGVSVFNKNGEFVRGLAKEDFQLRVDGKLVTTLFFNEVTVTNPAATKGSGSAPSTPVAEAASMPGRTIAFVVDDLHLSPESLIRTRNLILKYIDEQMLPTDNIALVSSGGKIGFLQQFMGDKAVLRIAANRLIYSMEMSSNDTSPPPMTEYDAQSIARLDRPVTDYFVAATVRLNPGMLRATAEHLVQARARAVLNRVGPVTNTTLDALEATIRQAGLFQGRKAICFISDGFLLNPGNTDAVSRLNRITDAAARSNSVIYSFDAKGLDAALPADMSPIGFQMQSGGRFEMQDGLSYVANNTGGQFIHNTNDLKTNLAKVTQEAFTYYLLAWEPDLDQPNSQKLKKIEVSIKGKPDLKVRVQNGYFNVKPEVPDTENGSKKPVTKPLDAKQVADQPMIRAARSQIPQRELPTLLATRYLDSNEGATMAATIRIDTAPIDFVQVGELSEANIEILGLIYDSEGKQEKSFKIPLKISIPTTELNMGGHEFDYDYKTILKPGLYQLRISSRDTKSGKIGSAFQWLEIPDLASRKLALSSVFLGERKHFPNKVDTAPETDEAPLEPSLDHRFERSSLMQYLIFVYNASSGKSHTENPDISVQAQILNHGNTLKTDMATAADLGTKDDGRLPYTGKIPLQNLDPGFYELKITVIDKKTNKSTVRQTSFRII